MVPTYQLESPAWKTGPRSFFSRCRHPLISHVLTTSARISGSSISGGKTTSFIFSTMQSHQLSHVIQVSGSQSYIQSFASGVSDVVSMLSPFGPSGVMNATSSFSFSGASTTYSSGSTIISLGEWTSGFQLCEYSSMLEKHSLRPVVRASMDRLRSMLQDLNCEGVMRSRRGRCLLLTNHDRRKRCKPPNAKARLDLQ